MKTERAQENMSLSESFEGRRVVAFETRRAKDMRRLIENFDGYVTMVPSMREIPLHANPPLLEFQRLLFAGNIDVFIAMTGVGTRMLARLLDEQLPHDAWVPALSRIKVLSRGPKPLPVLRDLEIPVRWQVPEPNTWRELLAVLDAELFPSCANPQIVVQDFPTLDTRFLEALQQRGASVLRVPVYRYALPDDPTPLRKAVYSILANGFDVALFTTGVQVWHLFKIASDLQVQDDLRDSLGRLVVGSVGPTNTEVLRDFGVQVDVEPEHPKMGHLVKHAASQSAMLLKAKGHISASRLYHR